MPAGAEERAVRAAAPRARIVVVRPGARASEIAASVTDGPAVILGLCGALRTLGVGDAALYTGVCDDRDAIALDAAPLAALAASLPEAAHVRAFTAARVVTRVAERRRLAVAYDADVVDMEGTHLARTLQARGIPFGMVRVVSDDGRFDLPPIEDAIDADGALRPLQLLAAFASDPAGSIRFVRDVTRSLRALGALAARLAELR